MEFGILLYDALVSASVPPDKAKAVVQAIEKAIFKQPAPKQDLQLQLQAMTRELTLLLTLRLGAIMAVGFIVMLVLLKSML